MTYGLEGRCSIQLSYGQQIEMRLGNNTRKIENGLSMTARLNWSEYKDSNLGPPGPKPGALPDCATLREKESYRTKAFQSIHNDDAE
ncbi:MAG: hypothetical protein JWQ21_3189 [Herminiimonas sp.]|nr:hypothetical protein [Herminiimonas sp.]